MDIFLTIVGICKLLTILTGVVFFSTGCATKDEDRKFKDMALGLLFMILGGA
ncbi:MAG: hypothetical protein ACUZ8H_09340 [Candidatus Anammoxibacter sp.]